MSIPTIFGSSFSILNLFMFDGHHFNTLVGYNTCCRFWVQLGKKQNTTTLVEKGEAVATTVTQIVLIMAWAAKQCRIKPRCFEKSCGDKVCVFSGTCVSVLKDSVSGQKVCSSKSFFKWLKMSAWSGVFFANWYIMSHQSTTSSEHRKSISTGWPVRWLLNIIWIFLMYPTKTPPMKSFLNDLVIGSDSLRYSSSHMFLLQTFTKPTHEEKQKKKTNKLQTLKFQHVGCHIL